MFPHVDSRRAQRPRTRPLNFDALEARALLAGNVTVPLLPGPGPTTIQGDNLGNHIQVDQSGLPGNQLRVTGVDGTTINNQSDPVVVTVTKDLRIDLKDGDDDVALDGVGVGGDVIIAMGRESGGDIGHSVMVNSCTIGRDLKITTGDGTGDRFGNRILVEASSIGRDLEITTGDGTGRFAGNVVGVTACDIERDVAIKVGDGTATGNPSSSGPANFTGNDVSVNSGDIGRDLTITTGTGASVQFGNQVAVFTTGSGGGVATSIGRDLAIKTGAGKTVIILSAVTVQNKTEVRTGPDDDFFLVELSTFFGRVRFDSGKGTNVFMDSGDNVFTFPPTLVHF